MLDHLSDAQKRAYAMRRQRALYGVASPQSDAPPPPAGKDERAVRELNASADVPFSQMLGGARSVALNPDSAEAYTGIAALGSWKEAGESAEQAVRLAPDFESARDVLPLGASKIQWRPGALARNRQNAAIVLASLPASDLFASAFRPPLCRLLPGFGSPAQSDKDDFNY
jgi:hypothetical protein